MTNKERFEELCRANIKREGVDQLLFSLAKTDFYTAPASTRFHDSEPEGLVKHSLNVYNKLIQRAINNPNYNLETLTIISLFHDLCKANYYEETTRNVKNKVTGKWEQEPYYTVNDLFPMGHGEKSIYMIREFMTLSPEEAISIRWHMGGYEPRENYQYLSDAFNKFPLAVELHLADMEATYLIESRGN